MSRTVVALMWMALALTASAETEQWPQFRGRQGGVADDDPTLPDRWSETENVMWKADVPGLGWSSPIVWGDHVFVTTAVSSGTEVPPVKGLFDPLGDHGRSRSSAVHRWLLMDFDFASGTLRWQRELHNAAPPTAIGNAHRTVRRTPYRSSESPMVICSRPKPRWKALDHRPSCRALSP